MGGKMTSGEYRGKGLKNIIKTVFCLGAAGIFSCNFSFTGGGGAVDSQALWQSSIQPEYLPARKTYAENSGTVQIGYEDLRQAIDGFGGSNAWTGLPGNSAAADRVIKLLYSKTEGAGFTILRNRVPFREFHRNPDGSEYDDGFVVRNTDRSYKSSTGEDGAKTFTLNWGNFDLQNTKTLISKIKGLGSEGPETLTLMSTPWTPPNNGVTRWKPDVEDWNKPDVGGRLDPDHYEDYADLLADYVKGFESQMNAPLAVLSVQNEPHWEPDYESCLWSGEEIRDFLIVIGRRFALKGVGASLGIMAPEDENFREDFIIPSLNNAGARAVLTHVGLHQYEGASDSTGNEGAERLPAVSARGKRIWQTEVSGSGPFMPAGDGIDNALYYAKMIHLDMTLAETNAFLFWWLWQNGGSNAGSLIAVNGGAVNEARRLYAMGQYSRFIRPGWRRIGSTASPVSGVYSSAYRPASSGKIALVLINDNNSSRTFTLKLDAAAFGRLEAWRTSETEKLAPVGGPVFSSGSAQVNVTLSAKSITTFYGDISG
jgi:O-glycosyl hydrolase